MALYNRCFTFEASENFEAFTYRVIISATETIAIAMVKEKITAGAATTLAIYNSNSGSKSSDCKGNNNNNSNCKGCYNKITSDENIHFYNNIDNNTHLSSNKNSDR